MLTKEEMETIIRFDRVSEKCTIWTSDPKIIRKLDRKKYPVISQAINNGEVVSREYETNKKHISFRFDPLFKAGEITKKKMSPAQLANLDRPRKNAPN